MMNKKFLTIYERDILCGALPDILTYKREPFPFNEMTKFFTKYKYNTKKS